MAISWEHCLKFGRKWDEVQMIQCTSTHPHMTWNKLTNSHFNRSTRGTVVLLPPLASKDGCCQLVDIDVDRCFMNFGSREIHLQATDHSPTMRLFCVDTRCRIVQ